MALAVGAGVAASAVCAAAGMASGATQTIRVETPGADGARCELRNDLGVWVVESTPGPVTVAVSPKPLEVACAAQGAGSPLGPTRVPSTKGEASSSVAVAGAIAGGAAAVALAAAAPMFAPMVLGQLLVPAIVIGAGTGGMVDEASRPVGYPETISVPLVGHARPVDPTVLAAAPLGIAVRGLTASEIATSELASADGALVTRTAPGGRADRGGVRVGDIVVACNDAQFAGAAGLEAMVRSAKPGQPLKLRVWRERQWVEIALPAATERP
jgi:serine protease Do